jgi:hypothetical protein
MFYFVMSDKGLAAITTESPKDGAVYFTRHDFKSFEVAEEMATAATKFSGELYIATDAGKYSWPQFDVIKAPKVGDKVSQSFNGDSYPRGEIVKVSKSLKLVTTSTGHKFYRHKRSGAWMVNGYASMIPGHVSEMNPSF